MVKYFKALKVPFMDIKKLFIGTFVLLGFLILWIATSLLFTLTYFFGPPVVSSIFMQLVNLVLYAIPAAFFLRDGINAATCRLKLTSWKDIKGLFIDGIKFYLILYIWGLLLTIVSYFVTGIHPFTMYTPEAQLIIGNSIMASLRLFLIIMLPLILLLFTISALPFNA